MPIINIQCRIINNYTFSENVRSISRNEETYEKFRRSLKISCTATKATVLLRDHRHIVQ